MQQTNEVMRSIKGSERVQPVSARPVAEVDPNEVRTVTVYVRPKLTNTAVPNPREHRLVTYQAMTAEDREKALEAFEADPRDLDLVAKYAADNHLKVLESSPKKRSILLEGKNSDLARAFGTELKRWEHRNVCYTGRVGSVKVPANLAKIIQKVFGLDNHPVGRPRLHSNRQRIASRIAQTNAYLPTDVGAFYDFPDGTDGSNQTIAILAFNGAEGDSGGNIPGGYDPEILKRYFANSLHLPLPSLTDVVVHGPGNTPGDGSDPDDATPEILLDICMAGGLAPKSNLVIYFTEFTEQGWVDAITTAVTADNRPSVISISYGNPEDGPADQILWTQQAITQVDEAFYRAAIAGITVCVASGDQGSTEQESDQLQHVDFPASSSWVLGCGGTRVVASNGAIVSETVWNDGPGSATGGGVSVRFPLPSYQKNAQVPPSVNPGHRIGRGVPDVAGIADPETGVLVAFPDGSTQVIGGTSATAPMWAALVARIDQALGKSLGFINPILYALPAGVLHDITTGDNGGYYAGPGWDACTGLGSPNGTRLLEALRNPPAPVS
jgi:kumamolisin